jgi:iron(III) transport system substrate-binding protein
MAHRKERFMKLYCVVFCLASGGLLSFTAGVGMAGDAGGEWSTALQGARKEGKVVVGIAPSAELRKGLEEVFGSRFPGIDLELVPARGPVLVNRVANESRAKVKYFDVLLPGAEPPLPHVDQGLWEQLEAHLVLDEVKNPRNWWGGHIWIDNLTTRRYVYGYLAYISASIWYNPTHINPADIQYSSDLLKPQLKAKIGFVDPRNPGSGQLWWSFWWKTQGEEFLTKLLAQNTTMSTDLRQIAEALAKGRHAITIGASYYSFQPFVEAGLPVKPLPHVKDGNPVANGNGALVVVKDPPHPNAAKVFVNWFLSREGQDFYGKAMRMGTRRLDVDTKWLNEFGVEATKDFMSLEDYYRQELHLQSTSLKVLKPARELAIKVLK